MKNGPEIIIFLTPTLLAFQQHPPETTLPEYLLLLSKFTNPELIGLVFVFPP